MCCSSLDKSTIQVSPLGTVIVITFKNHAMAGEVHSWVCANKTVASREAAKLRAMDHIEILEIRDSVVKQ